VFLFLILVAFHILIQYIATPLINQIQSLSVQKGKYFPTVWAEFKKFCGYPQEKKFSHCLQNIFKKAFASKKVFEWKLFRRNLVVNLVMGIMVVMMLKYFHDLPVLKEIEDTSMDWVMQVRPKIIPWYNQGIPEFVLVDIDDNSYKEWGYPSFTPRHHLKTLIETAVKANARFIVVDVDLSLRTSENDTLSPEEQELFKFIGGYKESYCKPTCPSIILVRPLIFPDEHSSSQVFGSKKTFLDKAVEQSAPYIQWASALFETSGSKDVSRRWSLWQPTCTPTNEGSVLPSVEVVVGALLRNGYPQDTQDLLTRDLVEPFKPTDCRNYVVPKLSEIRIGLLFLDVGEGIQQRILYNLPWSAEPPRILCYERGCDATTNPPLFMAVSAKEYAKSTSSASTKIFDRKIVVIGGSHSRTGGGDIHKTPLGDMPGAMVLINAIYSLLQPSLLSAGSGWWIKGLLILGMTVFFEFYSSLLAMVVFWVVSFFIMAWISIWSLKFGVWLDFVLPLLVVQFHYVEHAFEKLQEHEEKLEECKKQLSQLGAVSAVVEVRPSS